MKADDAVDGARVRSSRVMQGWRKLAVMWRLDGWSGIAELAWSRVWEKNEYLRLGLTLENRHSCPRGECGKPNAAKMVRGDWVGLREWRRRFRPAEIPREFWMDELRGLDFFYAGRDGEEWAHILWIALPGRQSSIGGELVESGEAEVRAVYTMEKHRRQGWFRLALQEAMKDLPDEGIHSLLAHVRPENEPSLQGFCTAGFQLKGRVITRRVCGFRWSHFTPVPSEECG